MPNQTLVSSAATGPPPMVTSPSVSHDGDEVFPVSFLVLSAVRLERHRRISPRGNARLTSSSPRTDELTGALVVSTIPFAQY
ncbi:hypothetical protein E4U53_007836 [Claviceps sorghi]|nr:hypothetical protein E4U53_007836 [Claviceps sorghi]